MGWMGIAGLYLIGLGIWFGADVYERSWRERLRREEDAQVAEARRRYKETWTRPAAAATVLAERFGTEFGAPFDAVGAAQQGDPVPLHRFGIHVDGAADPMGEIERVLSGG